MRQGRRWSLGARTAAAVVTDCGPVLVAGCSQQRIQTGIMLSARSTVQIVLPSGGDVTLHNAGPSDLPVAIGWDRTVDDRDFLWPGGTRSWSFDRPRMLWVSNELERPVGITMEAVTDDGGVSWSMPAEKPR